MESKLIWPIILQLLGVVVIIAEFILPSMGLLTVIAVGLFGYSLFLVFSHISPMAGLTLVIIDICMIPVLIVAGIKLLAASPAALRASLEAKNGARSQPPEWTALVGAAGTALTDLHPAGAALINNKRYDVVSRGDFVEKGSAVSVVSVEGNRIVVKREEADKET